MKCFLTKFCALKLSNFQSQHFFIPGSFSLLLEVTLKLFFYNIDKEKRANKPGPANTNQLKF